MLVDGGLEGVVDVADAVPEDVAEPDENGQLDPAKQEVVGQLLQVDGPCRVLRRMDQDVPRLGDRKVTLPPPLDLVQLGRVGDRKDLAGLPVAVTANRLCAHAIMIRHLVAFFAGTLRRGFMTRVHDEGSRRRFTTKVHDEGSRRRFTREFARRFDCSPRFGTREVVDRRILERLVHRPRTNWLVVNPRHEPSS